MKELSEIFVKERLNREVLLDLGVEIALLNSMLDRSRPFPNYPLVPWANEEKYILEEAQKIKDKWEPVKDKSDD